MFLVTLVSRQGGLEYVSKDGRTSMEEGGPGGISQTQVAQI